MGGLILRLPDDRLSTDDGRVIRAARTGGRGAGEDRPLATVALDHHAPRTPPVDPAEILLPDFVAPRNTLDYPRPLFSFPAGITNHIHILYSILPQQVVLNEIKIAAVTPLRLPPSRRVPPLRGDLPRRRTAL